MAAVGKVAGAAYGHSESGGGGGGGGSGGFLGPRLPAEVEAMARGLQEVGKETFRRLLKGTARPWAFSRREGVPCSRSPIPFLRFGATYSAVPYIPRGSPTESQSHRG